MCKTCGCNECSFRGDWVYPEPKVPHVHAECIKAWADGAEIEFYNEKINSFVSIKSPSWFTDGRYRVKPKSKVIKYRWVYSSDGVYGLTGGHYKDFQEFNEFLKDRNRRYKFLQPILDSAKEFDSD